MTQTLVHKLLASASRTPDAIALSHGTRQMTDHELRSDTSRFTAFLREEGLNSGDRVALLMENSLEYVCAYYGTLGAGGVAVGLNIAAKARDLLNWMDHCEATWLVAAAKHAELPDVARGLRERNIKLILVGEHPQDDEISAVHARWTEVMDRPASEPALEETVKSGEQPAAIIYTSGTTGNPKGVCLCHRNLVANTESILAYLNLTSADKIVNVLPFTYSYGNSILHTHLAVGGTVIMENSFVFPHKVVERIAAEGATGISGVPSTFALLLARTNLADYDLSALRYLTQAGGPMPPANQTRLKDILPDVKIFIMYGQTEATARLSYLPPERLGEKLGSCGIPIPGVEIEIRNSEGKPLPPHETGEIYARGENIMLKYWNAPEMTNEVLKDGWLKTGDLAHFDDDRFIFIDGRSSEMIKSGGQRISPIEIEDVICELDGVAEVGIVGVDNELLGQVIKAVVVPKPGVDLGVQTIKRYCLDKLAAYKVPKTITFADALPKTSSGKIRRHLL